jgi:hypothetical protein
MEKEAIVKLNNNKWCVELRDVRNNDKNIIKMSSKEDAVRYARICEQRMGTKVMVAK